MRALPKKIVSVLLICVLLILGAAAVNSTKGTASTDIFVPAEEPAEQELDVQEAYQKAEADLRFWYADTSYAGFFETAAQRYFDKTGIKVAVEYQNTIDYMGDIYDKTMQDEDFPDVYLIPGDNLEEAYLYGLVSVNGKGAEDVGAASNAVKASTYEGKLLGYPLSYNTCVFIFQPDYFGDAPESLQSIIDYSNDNEPADDVEYLLEWDVNDAFYDFPFISNSVTFEKTEAETMNVVYDEELYQQDLEYFETILASFSVDAGAVSEDEIVANFLEGRTLSAIIDTDSLHKLEGYSYALMKMPDLNETLTASTCAITDMLVVNDFSTQGEAASDFAHFVTVDMAGELYGMTGHFSVISSEEPDWVEQVAYESYETAVLVPDSQDAKDFWVKLEVTISQYFDF